MRKLFLSFTLIFIVSSLFSQNATDDLEILRDLEAAERKAVVADNMMLTEGESRLFWPIYDEYRAEARKIATKNIAMLQKFAENYEKMTNEVATEIMNEYIKITTEQIKLKSTFRNKMSKVLPPKLILRYFQIENKMDAIIEYGMAQEIPLSLK